jgi:1-acyl-sn-glycerol-3-phosphate acyltransferase
MEGWDELPETIRSGEQPAIFIANHASLFDPPLLISTLPCRPVFAAKKELARVPVLGWILLLAGFIFIDRRNTRRAAASLHLAARRIRAGQSIVAFPEGTRTRTGQMLPFKKGFFLLAWRAQVPIVPLGILGGRAILPPDHWRVAPGDYRIRVGKPMVPSQFTHVEAMRQTMEQEVLALSAEGK